MLMGNILDDVVCKATYNIASMRIIYYINETQGWYFANNP